MLLERLGKELLFFVRRDGDAVAGRRTSAWRTP